MTFLHHPNAYTDQLIQDALDTYAVMSCFEFNRESFMSTIFNLLNNQPMQPNTLEQMMDTVATQAVNYQEALS